MVGHVIEASTTPAAIFTWKTYHCVSCGMARKKEKKSDAKEFKEKMQQKAPFFIFFPLLIVYSAKRGCSSLCIHLSTRVHQYFIYTAVPISICRKKKSIGAEIIAT